MSRPLVRDLARSDRHVFSALAEVHDLTGDALASYVEELAAVAGNLRGLVASDLDVDELIVELRHGWCELADTSFVARMDQLRTAIVSAIGVLSRAADEAASR